MGERSTSNFFDPLLDSHDLSRAIQTIRQQYVGLSAIGRVNDFADRQLRPLVNSRALALGADSLVNQIDHQFARSQIDLASLGPTRRAMDEMQSVARSIENLKPWLDVSASCSLPDALETYRLDQFALAERMARQHGDWAYLTQSAAEAFQASAAVGMMFRSADWLGSHEARAISAFSELTIPDFSSVSKYGAFLDTAGLSLGHWPSVRLLTHVERRKRLRQRIAARRPSKALRKAYDLTYRYECVLRETIAGAMEDEYGPDWARMRLPMCDCKDLLGRWDARGGDILDHADFPHYERILAHPEHHAAIFHIAFENPEIAAQLMQRARIKRAASYHPGKIFSNEDLRELRLVWREIEVAMLALTPATTIDL